ncbi:hypothetical protein [Streptomyces sp. PH10-H1]|uniref:hypothetical protein n=1 Tax=Streptomyces sp. PH10-H1 TaxID=3046212 RepID=UPI0024BAD263|nr:hypothetical protein [Streptomyces sp. PH10-H1]MDJ0342555.1 hypothetical protein [Streptomyces sp. PH10-H1]
MNATSQALFKRPNRPARLGAKTARRPPRALAEPAAVMAGTALVGVQAMRLGRWIVDDAAITYAYTRSIDEGYGPVQQAGAPPVEGYSNPAWLALLVAGRRLRLFDHGALFGVPDLVWFPKLLALLCVVGMLAAVAAAARAALPGRAGAVTLLAGMAMAGNFSLVAWLFSGLENPLYGLATTVLAAVLVRGVARDDLLDLPRPRTAVAAGLLALLAALTRPDGVVYAAAYPLTLLLLLRCSHSAGAFRSAALSTAAFAVPYAAHLLWRHAEFGRWIPNTAVAKAQRMPGSAAVAHIGELVSFAGWALVLAAVVCTGLALRRPGPPRRALVAVLVPLSLALAAYGTLERDWMDLYRFATPVWTLGAFAGSLAAVTVRDRERPRVRVVLTSALLAGIVLSLAGQRHRAEEFRAHPTVPMCFIADRYGRLFNSYADRLGLPDAVLLLPDLGGTLLTSRLRLVDLAGLTDPAIADAYAADDMPRLRTYVFDRVRPTFIHVHTPWSTVSGLTPPVLTAHGYVPLSTQADTGDWVRRRAVPDPGRLTALQRTTLPAITHLTHLRTTSPHRSCGPRLTPTP